MRGFFCALALAGAALAQPAQAAVTITFAPLTHPGYHQVDDNYQEGGLAFNSSTPGYLFNWGTDTSFNPDPTGAALSVAGAYMDLVVTRVGGGAFDLIAFDLTSGFNEKNGSVPFTYTDATGVHSTTLKLDKVVGPQTFALNLTGVTRFTLNVLPPKFFQVDNIVVSYPVSAVPEPTTWALMILGFGGVGAALRQARRRELAI